MERIDALFAIEREVNGLAPAARRAARADRARPLVEALQAWLTRNRANLSAKVPLAKAIDYLLKRWAAFTRFLDDGRICLLALPSSRDQRCTNFEPGPPDGGRPEKQKGFVVQPRRWLVERTFGWTGRCRRLARDHEVTLSSALAFFVLAAAMIFVRRLAKLL